MKILVSAYACEPGKGSEPAVGWNWIIQIARFHEVWAITRSSNRRAIELHLADKPMGNVHWVYFDLPAWARFWKRGQRGVYLYYFIWQTAAYFLARRMHRRVSFDLVHHVTFVNYWLGSLLPFLPAPFVWGPVGGGESCPKAFLASFGIRGRLYELLRSAARWLGEHNPAMRLVAERVRVAVAATGETAGRLERLACRRVVMLSQVGLSREEIAALGIPSPQGDDAFRLASIGRFLPWKGFHLGLMAFAKIREEYPDSEYHLIGDGPQRPALERLAARLGVAERVRFWGLLPRGQVLAKLAACSVLVHPSLHDSGGWVCLEAMAAGLPVVCLDLGGPARLVTRETGFIIAALTPEQVVGDIAEVLAALALDPRLGSRLGEAGRKRMEQYFDWDIKGDQMQRIYEEHVGR
jgi:glycosyltransferase involved in cell wall biosynthesis